jgi:hypothetical protein
MPVVHPPHSAVSVTVSDERAKRLLAAGWTTGTAGSGEPPAKSATKDQWIEHAVAQGADPDDAAAYTKAELQKLYG